MTRPLTAELALLAHDGVSGKRDLGVVVRVAPPPAVVTASAAAAGSSG